MLTTVTKPGLIPTLHGYIEQRNKEYKALYKAWLDGTNGCLYAPEIWPASKCLLTNLPTELLLMVCEPLYQFDLFHLSLTCRALANITLHLLYQRDISDFDCLALRWACTFGIVPTLERAFSYGAPANHVFDPHSKARSSWVLRDSETGQPLSYWLLETALTTAILANEPEIVRLLLAHGAEVNGPDIADTHPPFQPFEIFFPIHFAMGAPGAPRLPTLRPGNPQIIRHLLDAGADPNQHTRLRTHVRRRSTVVGFKPLIMAMQESVPIETLKLLLERGADPTLLDSYQGTAFSYDQGIPSGFWDRSPLGAALICSGIDDDFSLDMDKVDLLLKHGGIHELAYICHRGRHYPLPMISRHWNHHQIVPVLQRFVANGADIASWATMVVPPIFTVIWWAERYIPVCYKRGVLGKAEEAINRVCDVIRVIAEATLVEGCAESVRKSAIIDTVVSPSIEVADGKRGQTALRYVCRPMLFEGAAYLIPFLLYYGADMNSFDLKGRTALHHAAMFGSPSRVRELVGFCGGPAASGLVVDVLDSRGWTPLHYACLFGLWVDAGGQAVTARLLLENGANVRAITNNGWTPLSLAVISANEDLVSLLLDHGAHFRDLFLRRGSETEPTMVPVGRIIFVHRNHPLGPALWGLASELRDFRARVAALLEQRFGVSIYLPPPADPVTLPSDHHSVLPSGSHMLPGALHHPLPQLRVDVVDQPFGLACLSFHDISANDFEYDIDDVLDSLERLGLEAFLVAIHESKPPNLAWQSYPPSHPANQ